MKRQTPVSQMDTTFVRARVKALKANHDQRNARMDEMEKLYLLDVWKDTKDPAEHRVTSPRSFTVVETTRSLMFSQRPQISVKASEVSAISQRNADAMEKYLYGVWDEMGFYATIDDAEFWADGLGLGVFRLVYDPNTPAGFLPLVARALDPRAFFYTTDPRHPLRKSEAAISYKRPRKEILDQWGEVPGDPVSGQSIEDWLDQEVEYVDYWTTRLVEVKEKPKTRTMYALEAAVQGIEEIVSEPDETDLDEDREGDKGRTTKKLMVVNAVMADGEFVKKPMILPGYEMIPFFHWAGIRTPLPGMDRDLSVLFPVSGGARRNGAQGLISAETMMLGYMLKIQEMRAAAAAVTDDPELLDFDGSAGAVNPIRPGSKFEFVVPPPAGQDIHQGLDLFEKLQEDATMPGAMTGRFQAAMSGVALSTVTNPVQMRMAARQRDREQALSDACRHILALTEEYAPLEGWTTAGVDRAGEQIETRLRPSQIKGYRRAAVKLSAKMPRDANGEAMTLRTMVDSKMISRRTARDRLIEILEVGGTSPGDEDLQILIEAVTLGDNDVHTALGKQAAKEFSAELAAMLEEIKNPPPNMPPGGPQSFAPPGMGPNPAEMPPGAPPGMGQGPMGGLPPGVLPPQEIPEAVGATDPLAMQRMMAPQPGPGRPPGAG